MQKGECRCLWIETRLPWVVIPSHYLPVVGGARRRKLPFGSFEGNPYHATFPGKFLLYSVSAVLWKSSVSKMLILSLKNWHFPIFYLLIFCTHIDGSFYFLWKILYMKWLQKYGRWKLLYKTWHLEKLVDFQNCKLPKELGDWIKWGGTNLSRGPLGHV